MFVLLIGSFIWCFVASVCDVELLIVKSALVAVSIVGVRPILVLSNSQSLISLLSMIGLEFRRLFSDIRCCLCVMFTHALWCYISLLCFAMVEVDLLAGLALLLIDEFIHVHISLSGFRSKESNRCSGCCRQSNDALDEDKYFVFLTFYRESSSVRDS
ncbi:hypothetical protein BRARA_D00949 [Brassica rapa]|uniref:Uncharacterized protein n=1 Tax=Brassica campestris TaxID=3711 RepID=A0A397ZJZ0_BRACM|nr:hypothetical protein BRARA_D00949 [Brassica rapa]